MQEVEAARLRDVEAQLADHADSDDSSEAEAVDDLEDLGAPPPGETPQKGLGNLFLVNGKKKRDVASFIEPPRSYQERFSLEEVIMIYWVKISITFKSCYFKITEFTISIILIYSVIRRFGLRDLSGVLETSGQLLHPERYVYCNIKVDFLFVCMIR